MKKQNLGLMALVLGGAGLAFYLYKQSKQAKETAKSIDVEPAGTDETEQNSASDQTPGNDGLIDRTQAKRLITEKLIPGAQNLLKKAKQKFKARKKRKSRVIIEPTQSITKEEFDSPITEETKKRKTRRTRIERQAARTEKRSTRKAARTEKRSARKLKRKRNVSGFDGVPLLV